MRAAGEERARGCGGTVGCLPAPSSRVARLSSGSLSVHPEPPPPPSPLLLLLGEFTAAIQEYVASRRHADYLLTGGETILTANQVWKRGRESVKEGVQ
jgi:hypothetical protein